MKTLNVVLSLSALATSALLALSISAQAAGPSNNCRRLGLNMAECSCQHALNMGTKRAIQLFLRQYPHSGTACNALNLTAARVQTGDGHADRPTVIPPRQLCRKCEY